MTVSALTDAVVAVVGGTSGFGREVATRAAAAGASVVVVGRDADKLRRVVAEIGDATGAAVTGHAADVAEAGTAASLFARIGDIDHLVSTVGGAMGGGFLTASFDEIKTTVDGKFLANLALVRAAARHLRAGGSVTLTAGAGGTPSTASGALIGNQAISTMVRGLAIELAPDVRVNAVAPAWTPTPLWRHLSPTDLDATARQMAGSLPLKRTATIPEVGDAYTFLMTATFVTGHTLFVDGGASLV
ncbi:MAG: SDR family oxidoreductase [Microbacterium sp.]|uniref:SDR family oxidoreductase n=1 Tax=Microbacterium sp. TaxID=51671 RepID=UPI0039E66682